MLANILQPSGVFTACGSRTRSLDAGPCSGWAASLGWVQGIMDHRGMCAELSLGCPRFHLLLPGRQAESLGFRATWWHVPTRPAQLPHPNSSSPSVLLKLWMNLKPTRLQSLIYSSLFGVYTKPQSPGSVHPALFCPSHG